jgi:NAD(P)-dependent dehydrogenase (short-subunit alcohol dehydrogenase family)
MQRLEGRTIVITGAASGFGRASAEACAAEGARVVLLDRDAAGVQAVAQSIGAAATAHACDVSQAAEVEAAFSGLSAVDGLVNSAGIARRQPLADQDEAGWDAVLDVNLKGIYLCSREAIRRMDGKGSIVHISSAVALIGFRNRPAYTASKGAIVALTRNMALDYAARQIRVNCICPGFARTGLTEPIFKDPERLARIDAMHPLGHMGEAEDIAKAVLFLLSDDARWITGIAMPVDGGISAGHQHDI